MRDKKILVTGGAGFIGSNLVNELSKDNDVTVLDNFSTGYRENITNPLVRIIEGDVRDYEIVDIAISQADVVFHLAASVGNKRSIDDPYIDATTNVLGTLYILEAARINGVKKVIVSSSAGIFGELKTLPIKEDHPAEPDSPYGCTKLCEEKLSLVYNKLYGIQVVALRYFNVYGENQRFDEYGNVIPIFVARMLDGKPLRIYGDGEQTRDFVHVKDVIQANIKAAESDVSGVFNIASGERVTINELAGMISDNVVYEKPRKGDVLHSLADTSKARELLGYEPQMDLKQGITKYINWYEKDIFGRGGVER